MTNDRPKPGYEQTEIGVIPEDWNASKIRDTAPLQRGFDLPTSQLKKGDYPVVYSNGIMNRHADFMVAAPGVVTGRSGTIGNVHYISENYWTHNTALWVTDFKDNDPKYIYYLYKAINLERFGTGSGVPTLNRNDVHDLVVALPPLLEQRSVSQALSDVDALIAGLDKAIGKKRAIKTATMQQLLTGKKRLLGFGEGKGDRQTEIGVIPEDWRVTQLKELIDQNRKITYGIVVPGSNISNGIPMIRAQDYSRGWVDINELYRVATEIDNAYKRSKVIAGDILLTIVGSVGNLAKVPFIFSGSNLTQQTARLAFNIGLTH